MLENSTTCPYTAVVLFSDEAPVCCIEYAKLQILSRELLLLVAWIPLVFPLVTVWCVVSEFGIWDPYFYKEYNVAKTMNSVRSRDFSQTNIEYHPPRGQCLLSKGRATGHTTLPAMEILREILMFPGNLSLLRGDLGRHGRSTDITPCDFSPSKVQIICPCSDLIL